MKIIVSGLAVCLVLTGAVWLKAQEKARPVEPMGEAQILALVAGDALPEDVVHFVSVRGLTFHPGDSYLAQLKTAGAAPSVIDALKTAKVVPPTAPEHDSSPELLGHLVTAATLKKGEQYAEATVELTSALRDDLDKSDVGFVMGDVLKRQENWEAAARVYEQVLDEDPNYPEAHTKDSYALYKTGDLDEALAQAKAALDEYPEDAEAHKDAGVAYDDMGNAQASLAEYSEALRIKPDYAVIHYDIGYFYDHRGAFRQAIEEYRKAIALDPSFVTSHLNLGLMLENVGDLPGAILEWRKAKELAPRMIEPRLDLANALMHAQSINESIKEYRELEALAPDSEMCHRCFAYALFNGRDFEGAENEFKQAVAIDPSDSDAYAGLGDVEMQKKNYDAALQDYDRGAELDPTSLNARFGAGRVLLTQKKYQEACEILKQAVEVRPSNAAAHDLYGQALDGAGNIQAAISEFSQSYSLDHQPGVMDELASEYEKNGDWVNALDQYRRAVTEQVTLESKSLIRQFAYWKSTVSPAEAYEAAKGRYAAHLAELRAAGKTAEAEELDKRVQATSVTTSLSDQLDAAMANASNVEQQGHIDEAEKDYRDAVDIALKMQPPDLRVVMSLWHLGNCYLSRKDFSDAQAAFDRELGVATTLYGKDSPNLTIPLHDLAYTSLLQNDYASADKYFSRVIDINEQTFGPDSRQVSQALVAAAQVPFKQKKYDEAESYLKHAIQVDESLNGKDSVYGLMSLGALCQLYDESENWQKGLTCDQEILSIVEKQFGSDSPNLISVLEYESHALRHLGKTEDADRVDARLKDLHKFVPPSGTRPMVGASTTPQKSTP
jgi:tetratricopeptide (TPR) repeat protein